MLRRLFLRWETSIFADDADERLPQEFRWGLRRLDGLIRDEFGGVPPEGGLPGLAAQLVGRSERFYQAPEMRSVEFDGHRLRFDSPFPADEPEVNRVSARLFESPRANGRAVVVIPQWNADSESLVKACRILNLCGLTALRLTLPYHEERRPQGMLRADAMVGPELGLTLQSIRRAVIETRQLVGWLLDRGYRRVGLFGTSLGSCVGFLALSHDSRVSAAVFNHVAGDFADVVWSGLATKHVRESLDPHVDLATLRRCWAPISPSNFAARLTDARPALMLISGAYDPIFLPQHSQALVDALHRSEVDFRRIVLPCGHYTLGKLPFYFVDAYLVTSFLRRHLSA